MQITIRSTRLAAPEGTSTTRTYVNVYDDADQLDRTASRDIALDLDTHFFETDDDLSDFPRLDTIFDNQYQNKETA